jgi:membrane protease YdiL (CAAX protease family)
MKMSIPYRSAFFIIIAFAISWGSGFAAWANNLSDLSQLNGYFTAGAMYLSGPPVAAIVCAVFFEKSRWLGALGLRMMPNRWWLLALLLPLALALGSIAINMVAEGQSLMNGDAWSAALAALQRNPIASNFPSFAIAVAFFAIFFTLTEELGWRGYLYHLWHPLGFWKSTIAIGLVWGIWHWPLILFFGLFMPDAPMIGLIIYPFTTILTSVYINIVRENGGSVCCAGIMHGTLNAIGGTETGPHALNMMALLSIGVIIIRFSYIKPNVDSNYGPEL